MVVKSNAPDPSAFSRFVHVTLPAPLAINEPEYPVTELESTRRPAPQNGTALFHVALDAPEMAFTAIRKSCEPVAVVPPMATLPSAERKIFLVPLISCVAKGMPKDAVPMPSAFIVNVAPVI